MEFSFGIHYLPPAFLHWGDIQVLCEDVKDLYFFQCVKDMSLEMHAKYKHILGPEIIDFRRIKLVMKAWAQIFYVVIQTDFTNTSEHNKTNKMNCAPSEASVQPRNLIRVFVRRFIYSLSPKHLENSDQTDPSVC